MNAILIILLCVIIVGLIHMGSNICRLIDLYEEEHIESSEDYDDIDLPDLDLGEEIYPVDPKDYN